MRARVRDTTIYFDVDGMGLVPDGDRWSIGPCCLCCTADRVPIILT
ncbi:MAG: hypothetical protein Ct9H300mP1_29550 [Planctomycetaceae bacterium]|nr:MAG: hypothetical protein Ct9H300mP1_29550 [Planctomycetaceae bacterium]